MARWIWTPITLPTDGATVWVRAQPWATAPFLATFDAATMTFEPPWIMPRIPWTDVSRWKAQT